MTSAANPDTPVPGPKKTLSLKFKLTASLLSLLIVNGVYFYFGVGAVHELRHFVVALYDRVVMSGTYAQMVRNDFAQYSSHVVLEIVSDKADEHKALETKQQEALDTLNDDIAVVRERSFGHENAERVKDIQASITELKATAGEVLKEANATHALSAKRKVELVQSWMENPLRVKVSEALSDLSDHVVADGYNYRESAIERSTFITTASIICSVAVLILNVLCLLYILASLLPQLRRLTSIVTEIAAGAFSKRVQVRTTDEFGVLGKSFNQMLGVLDQRDLQIREQLVTTNAMLNSLSQGFMMVDRNGVCQTNYSRVCVDLFEGDPAGRPLREVLKLTGAPANSFNDWFEELMKSAELFDILSDVGPKRYPHSRGRTIELVYRPLADANGNVTNMIIIATDTTAEVKARESAQREQAFSRMVVKLTQNRRQFSKFLVDVNNMLAQISPDPALLNDSLRMIHTIKGGAATFSMLSLRDAAHRSETDILERKKAGAAPADMAVQLRMEAATLKEAYKRTLRELEEQCAFLIDANSAMREFSTKTLLEFYRLLQDNSGSQQLPQAFVQAFLFEPVKNMIAPFNETVRDIARRQHKMVHDLVVNGGDLLVYPERYSDLFASLVHVFRNAIDHGVESGERRQRQGKDPIATISVNFSRQIINSAYWIRIEVADDGRGIDPAALRAKLKEMGRESQESDREIIQRVFEPSVSTAAQVTDISGRGIGMDAVRATAVQLGGQASVESAVGVGTTVIILVPELAPERFEMNLAAEAVPTISRVG